MLSSLNILAQNKDSYSIDDIVFLINKAKSNDKSISDIEKLSFAESAKRLAQEIDNDSLVNQALRYIALNNYNLRNYNLLKKSSIEYLNHSKRIKDSFSIAKAYLYLGQYFYDTAKSDSAYFNYYNAEKVYRAINEDQEVAKTLLKIAIIQKNEKDFIGSEVSTVEAIDLLSDSELLNIQSSLYNNLGMVNKELGDFSKSLEYYKKSLEILRKINPPRLDLVDNSINNIAAVHKEYGQYEKAIDNFELILENQYLAEKRPSFYSVVLDNYAHTKFLQNEVNGIPELYHKALRICDSINDYYPTITINKHLSEYYHSINVVDSAKFYAYKAKELASRFHNDDYLKTLLHLSEVEEDSIAVNYYQEYIKLNDSLVNNERAIRNKFARIRYETKEIEERSERIERERLYLLILSIGLLLTIFLTYSTISQRAKNKELKLNQLQQEANEEIYNLMLTQQDRIEEARSQEKRRISEELHDGILGRLFGTRLSLDSLNKKIDEENVKTRSGYLDELKTIEQEIRKISHDLSSDFVEGSSYFDIIKTLVEKQCEAYNLEYELNKNEDINWEEISNKTKINVYRIIQESLLNIYKHAKANFVKINFELKNDFILLEITDNGEGFDTNKVKKGIGLKNIASRVKDLNGDLNINSMRGNGTTILVLIPK